MPDEGQDPHHAFYKGAMGLRDAFAEQSRRRLLDIREHLRPYKTLVTLVDTPIFAGAFPVSDTQEGLQIDLSYVAHVIDADAELELNEWEVYSENGEYPIEVPSDIDMERLLRLDQRIVRGETAPSMFGGKLLIG